MESSTEVVLMTGMAGAGKSAVINIFEDMGYYAVDNLPPLLIKNFLELAVKAKKKSKKFLIVCDVRGGDFVHELIEEFENLKNKKIEVKLLFMDSNDKALSKRFSETRREHPLKGKSLVSDLKKERKLLKPLKEKADFIIDTSDIEISDLNIKIHEIFRKERGNTFKINILSFGHKYGLPIFTDYIFDVRFIKNPYYVDSLKNLTGKDKTVFDFVFNEDGAKEFVNEVIKMIKLVQSGFIKNQKNSLTISFGCTGGKHRSVAMAIAVYGELKKQKYNISISHREI